MKGKYRAFQDSFLRFLGTMEEWNNSINMIKYTRGIKGACRMIEIEPNERRKYKRLPIELRLEVDRIFKQDYVVIEHIDAEISVFDISRNGLGFESSALLPNGYYFNALINLSKEDFFRVVIQIVRVVSTNGDKKVYGAEFVGLAPFLADKVDNYEKKLF